MPRADGSMIKFEYYFAQQEAVETLVYLYDEVKVRDKYDLLHQSISGSINGRLSIPAIIMYNYLNRYAVVARL